MKSTLLHRYIMEPARFFLPPAKGLLFTALLLACSAGAAPSAWCQDAPAGPLHPKPGVQPEPMPPAEQLKHAIRVRVNQVTTPVIVRDASGEMVFDLKEPNFKVYDNGTQQKIDHFDVGGDPLSIVLVMEASSHIAPMFPTMKRAGIIFTETVMAQTSEAAVISYDSTVDLRAKFTTDNDAVRDVIEHLPIGVDESLL